MTAKLAEGGAALKVDSTARQHVGPGDHRSNVHGAGVTLTSLVKRYGNSDTAAVQDVDLDVAPGEFVTLLGPSGSGKTSTLMMVAGFETVTSGDIAIGGRSVQNLPPHKRDIGMVFQSYALFPHMTVRDNVAFPLKMRRWRRADIARAVDESLKLVRLSDFAERYPSQLSGGQQQRVALARATVFSPKLLLMDEPLGALDRQLRQAMQFEIKKVQRSLGLTVISVTHDQEEALTMSDRIVVMNDGRIVQVGAPHEIYERPATDFVADFVGETNLLRGTVVGGGPAGSSVQLESGATLVTATELQVGNSVTLSVRPERVEVAEASALVDRPNVFQAHVDEWAYSGATTRGVLRLGESALIVRVEEATRLLDEDVTVHINPSHVVVVEERKSATPVPMASENPE